MKNEIVRGLTLNVALLLSISIVYNAFLIKVREKKLYYEVLLGGVTGFVGILLIINSVQLETGVIFDTRSILISMCGLFFGLVPTAVAAVMIAGYRIFIGGPGVLTGVTVTLLTAVSGLLWRWVIDKRKLAGKKSSWFNYYVFGLITHLIMLLCMLTLPPDVMAATIRQISLPILTVYPVGSLLLCLVMASGVKNVRTNRALEASELRFRTMFEQAPIGITVADNHQTLFSNTAYEQILGRSKEEIKKTDWADLTHPDDLQADIDLFKDLQAGRIKEYSIVKRFIRPDGSAVWVNLIVAALKGGNRMDGSHLCMAQDITERRQKEEEIVYLTYHDILTGLYNRAFFDEARKRLDLPEMMPLSFIIGDIDGLKIVNDAFGHAQGDVLLKETAQIVKSCCRQEDIIARTGGDEFCVLLPKTDIETARAVFLNMREAFSAYSSRTDKDSYFTSVSLGYSTKISTEQPFANVYKEAEENMYRRKLFEKQSLHSSLLTSIKTTMLEKSNETEAHAERMADLSTRLGQELGLDERELTALELVSTLHDVGKISIDKDILTKPGALDEDEWAEIRKHPLVGYRIAQAVPELRHIADYILCHHERWDGKGYPQGLAGEEIPLLSRILAVVDAYDSMTQDRAYRKAMTQDAAIAELLAGCGAQFDAGVVHVFLEKVLGDAPSAG